MRNEWRALPAPDYIITNNAHGFFKRVVSVTYSCHYFNSKRVSVSYNS